METATFGGQKYLVFSGADARTVADALSDAEYAASNGVSSRGGRGAAYGDAERYGRLREVADAALERDE